MEKAILEKFGESVKSKLFSQLDVKNKVRHNHPPVRFQVAGCECCERFGNYFCDKFHNVDEHGEYDNGIVSKR